MASNATTPVPSTPGGSDDDHLIFRKALPSDVEDAAALRLLTHVCDTNEAWHEFHDEDIQQVVEVCSILKMTGQR
jgi:hypothetical protein